MYLYIAHKYNKHLHGNLMVILLLSEMNEKNLREKTWYLIIN